MNITLIPLDCKPDSQVIQAITNQEFQLLSEIGLISQKSRSYHMEFQYREISIECPVILDKGKPVGIILPTFKLPYRDYPCFVYLYAVVLYLTGISMRKAAKQTKVQFGLEKFSHSTISRVMKVLILKTDNISGLDAPQFDGQNTPSIVIRKHWDSEYTTKVKLLLKCLSPILSIPEEYGIFIVYSYYMRYCSLLI